MGALPLCGDALRSCGEGVTFKLSNVQQSVVFHISFWRGLELYLEVLSLLNPPRGDGTSSDLHKVFSPVRPVVSEHLHRLTRNDSTQKRNNLGLNHILFSADNIPMHYDLATV